MCKCSKYNDDYKIREIENGWIVSLKEIISSEENPDDYHYVEIGFAYEEDDFDEDKDRLNKLKVFKNLLCFLVEKIDNVRWNKHQRYNLDVILTDNDKKIEEDNLLDENKKE